MPRVAALEAMWDELARLGAHDRGYAELISTVTPQAWWAAPSNYGIDREFVDKIATTSTEGELTTLTFPQEKVRVRQTECHETTQIYAITPDGTVHYKQDCRQGAMATVTDGHAPVTTDAAIAAQLHPGQAVRVMNQWVVVAYAKDGKRPVMVLGAPL